MAELPASDEQGRGGLEYGQRQETAAALAAVPLKPGGGSGSPAVPARGGGRRGRGGRSRAQGLMDYVVNRPTDRSDEALTHGMAEGEGAGPEILPIRQEPDLRTLILETFAERGGNADAKEMLDAYLDRERGPVDSMSAVAARPLRDATLEGLPTEAPIEPEDEDLL